jgi:hypothetical protein
MARLTLVALVSAAVGLGCSARSNVVVPGCDCFKAACSLRLVEVPTSTRLGQLLVVRVALANESDAALSGVIGRNWGWDLLNTNGPVGVHHVVPPAHDGGERWGDFHLPPGDTFHWEREVVLHDAGRRDVELQIHQRIVRPSCGRSKSCASWTTLSMQRVLLRIEGETSGSPPRLLRSRTSG